VEVGAARRTGINSSGAATDQRQIDAAIDWGRYAELFDHDADAQHLARL
jgi:hypothetical protein